jgi:fucose 4-O-acetylase-like acetyltransferase
MAATILVLAPLAFFDTRERIRFGALAGLAIAGASPFISQLGFAWLHPFLRNYLVPNPNFFPLFPWGAFLAFGLSAGSVLRLVKEEEMNRVMQWAALGGIVLILGARFAADLPFSLYPQSDFWLNGPALIFIKTGVILLLACWAFLLTNHLNPHGWSFVRQLGTTSLLVYWVHTELVYGRWLGAWKENLSVPQTILMAFFVIAAMVLLSVARTGWHGFPGVLPMAREWWASVRQPLAQPAAGD